MYLRSDGESQRTSCGPHAFFAVFVRCPSLIASLIWISAHTLHLVFLAFVHACRVSDEQSFAHDQPRGQLVVRPTSSWVDIIYIWSTDLTQCTCHLRPGGRDSDCSVGLESNRVLTHDCKQLHIYHRGRPARKDCRWSLFFACPLDDQTG